MGFPIGIIPAGSLPVNFPRAAYNLVYNEYYRSQDLEVEVSLTNEDVLLRGWEKDYFTSCLPYQQRGTPPALPISGSSVWDADIITNSATASSNLTVEGSTADNLLHLGSSGTATGRANAVGALNDNVITTATFDTNDLRLVVQIQKFLERNMRAGVRYKEFLLSHFGCAVRDDRLQRPEFIGGTRSPIIVSEVLQTSGTPGEGSTYTDTPQGTMAGHGIT